MSLGRIKESIDARLGSSVSLRTLNRGVREMAQLVLCSFIPPQASLLCSTNGSSVALPAAQTRSPVTGTILLSVLSLTQVVFPDGRIHYPRSVD
jgi:hypothetical protein